MNTDILVAGLYSPPFRSQYILLVHQCPAIKVISQIINNDRSSGYPSTKSYSCFPCRTFIAYLGNLGISVIKQIVPIQKQGIPLHHLHIVKSFQRIRFLIETGTVTIHIYTVVTERNVPIRICASGSDSTDFLQHIRMTTDTPCFSRFLFPFLAGLT
mgnify:CR=1 FL=1